MPRKRSEEHTSELQSLTNLVCRLLLEKTKTPAGRPTLTLPRLPTLALFVVPVVSASGARLRPYHPCFRSVYYLSVFVFFFSSRGALCFVASSLTVVFPG